MIESKPHYRLYTDGKLYRWRGHLVGWKLAGYIIDGRINLRRYWATPNPPRSGAYS